MRKIASLWIGDTLGIIELASINSFLQNGHDFILYAYQYIDNVPSGVTLRDANEILSGNPIIYHKRSGSPAIHSDLFRYALMAQTDYIWVDLDLIALKPFDFQSEWIIGYESEDSIGAAVMRVPQSSKTLQSLLELNATSTRMPPLLTGFKKIKYQFKSIWYRGLNIEKWPYGITGPGLITYYMHKFDENKYALPQHAFYPIHYRDINKASQLNNPNLSAYYANSWAIHLWGKALRHHIKEELNGVIPKGSLLDEIFSKYC